MQKNQPTPNTADSWGKSEEIPVDSPNKQPDSKPNSPNDVTTKIVNIGVQDTQLTPLQRARLNSIHLPKLANKDARTVGGTTTTQSVQKPKFLKRVIFGNLPHAHDRESVIKGKLLRSQPAPLVFKAGRQPSTSTICWDAVTEEFEKFDRQFHRLDMTDEDEHVDKALGVCVEPTRRSGSSVLEEFRKTLKLRDDDDKLGRKRGLNIFVQQKFTEKMNKKSALQTEQPIAECPPTSPIKAADESQILTQLNTNLQPSPLPEDEVTNYSKVSHIR